VNGIRPVLRAAIRDWPSRNEAGSAWRRLGHTGSAYIFHTRDLGNNGGNAESVGCDLDNAKRTGPAKRKAPSWLRPKTRREIGGEGSRRAMTQNAWGSSQKRPGYAEHVGSNRENNEPVGRDLDNAERTGPAERKAE
jgi:hypothetical protein